MNFVPLETFLLLTAPKMFMAIVETVAVSVSGFAPILQSVAFWGWGQHMHVSRFKLQFI